MTNKNYEMKSQDVWKNKVEVLTFSKQKYQKERKNGEEDIFEEIIMIQFPKQREKKRRIRRRKRKRKGKGKGSR